MSTALIFPDIVFFGGAFHGPGRFSRVGSETGDPTRPDP